MSIFDLRLPISFQQSQIANCKLQMKLSDLTSHAGEWLRGSGPLSEIVISSRMRLARNIAGHHFLTKSTRPQRTSLEHKVRDVVLSAQLAPQMLYVDLENAP